MNDYPSEEDAVKFLESRGYTLTADLDWIVPDDINHAVDDAELGAICFLFDNHEFGGFHGARAA